MAEFPRRQAPATLRLKELIATRLGSPRLLFCHQRVPTESHSGQRALPNARRSRARTTWSSWSTGAAMWSGSEPTSVLGLSHVTQADPEEIDYEMMSLDFSGPSGPGTRITAQISSGRYMPGAGPRPWPIVRRRRCKSPARTASRLSICPSTLVWFDKAGRHMESLDSERPVGEQMLSQFHRAVTSLVRNTSGLEDAYRAMLIVQQAHRSHAEGCRIALDRCD